MIDEHDRLLKIDECERLSAKTFFIYKPTWNLIISPLKWSIGKTKEEIMTRRGKTRYHQTKEKNHQKSKNWQLIIETLNWVLEDTAIDPLQSRRYLIPFA